MTNDVLADRTYSKQYLPGVNGAHSWCAHDSPSARHMEGRLSASDEGQLDRLANFIGIRSAIPPRTHLGTIFQHHCILDRYIYQCIYEEEASCCAEKEALR